MTKAVASPCNKICQIDQRTGLCLSCHRTVDEITAWGRLSEADRRAVMAELPHRAGPSPQRSAR